MDRIESRVEAVRVEVIEELRERSCLGLELESGGGRTSWVVVMYCWMVEACPPDWDSIDNG